MGREAMLAVSAPAIMAEYRFFSYRDSSLLWPSMTPLAD